MNILYLHCHDAGRYIEPYGYPAPTPNLKRLATEGVLFRNAHCANPTCSPSRACLLTGQRAHSAGMYGLAHRGWRLRDYNQTLMSYLRERAGFKTVLCGTQHIANPPFAQQAAAGYDEILTLDNGFNEPTRQAELFLARHEGGPFFLDVGFHAPHRAGKTGDFPRLFEPEDERYIRPPACLPDNPETRRDFALYAASMRSTDFAMGRVLDALERYGHADNTLVICTTDHGPAFPGMKCRLTDHGTGVFLLMRGPGGFRGGAVSDALISQTDVFPTVCETLGLEVPSWVQGSSFAPLASGDSAEERDAVFAEVNYHASWEPMRSVRTQRWKYIRHFEEGEKTTVLPNIDNSLSKLLLVDHGLRDRKAEQEELFDLVYDPQETRNLAADPEHASVREEMAGRLEAWMRETGDFLLENKKPETPDMKVTDRDAYDPSGDTDNKRNELPWTANLLRESPHAPAQNG